MKNRPSGVGLHNWREWPNSRWAFQHIRELIPTACIPHSKQQSKAFARAALEPAQLHLNDPGEEQSLAGLLQASHTDAFLVLVGGAIAMEWQAGPVDIYQPHILFSVSKSVTAILSGILADKGMFDPDAPVADYLPRTKHSAYGDCSMRHVLDMTVDLDFEENYTDPDSDYVAYRNSIGWNPVDQRDPGPDLENFLLTIRPGNARHGATFSYRSPNSDLLGLVLERAAGEPLADLFSKYLWQPLGAGGDAYITLDRSGLARGAGGICATIHDLARIGQLMLTGGKAGDRPLVSGDWVADTFSNGDPAAWRAGGFTTLFPNGKYRNQWYQVGDADRSLCALGIHGQYLYINPARGVVIAKLSSMPVPLDETVDISLLAAFSRIAQRLG